MVAAEAEHLHVLAPNDSFEENAQSILPKFRMRQHHMPTACTRPDRTADDGDEIVKAKGHLRHGLSCGQRQVYRTAVEDGADMDAIIELLIETMQRPAPPPMLTEQSDSEAED